MHVRHVGRWRRRGRHAGGHGDGESDSDDDALPGHEHEDAAGARPARPGGARARGSAETTRQFGDMLVVLRVRQRRERQGNLCCRRCSRRRASYSSVARSTAQKRRRRAPPRQGQGDAVAMAPATPKGLPAGGTAALKLLAAWRSSPCRLLRAASRLPGLCGCGRRGRSLVWVRLSEGLGDEDGEDDDQTLRRRAPRA